LRVFVYYFFSQFGKEVFCNDYGFGKQDEFAVNLAMVLDSWGYLMIINREGSFVKKTLCAIVGILLISVCAVTAFGADKTTKWVWPAKSKLFVGFSQADLASTWRTVETKDMDAVAKKRGYKIAVTNAKGDTEQQISDVESLLAQGCNVMVIVAIDADAIKPALDACKAKGVPVIMKARGSNGTPGVDYVTSIMSDFVWEGEQAGKWIANAAKKKGLKTVKVVEIEGVIGGTDVRDRGQGFQNAADAAGNFQFIAKQSANWSRSQAQEVTRNILQSTGGKIDAIYCQNDEMALGASLALQAAGLKVNKDVFLVGVDGMYESFNAVKAGTMSASVTCTPKYANLIFDTIEAGMAKKVIAPKIAVHDALVDATNVEKYYNLGF
jgi:galactofuranose transport system substrate-binding protein